VGFYVENSYGEQKSRAFVNGYFLAWGGAGGPKRYQKKLYPIVNLLSMVSDAIVDR
jgi:hypothetical protein